MLDELKHDGKTVLDGHKAFDLYATYGLPLEISRDIAREQSLDVDEAGFKAAREEHSLASGGGKAMGAMGDSDAEFFSGISKDLMAKGKLALRALPMIRTPVPGPKAKSWRLVVNGQIVSEAQFGDKVEIILPKTGFYIESGGQVGDTGSIRSLPLRRIGGSRTGAGKSKSPKSAIPPPDSSRTSAKWSAASPKSAIRPSPKWTTPAVTTSCATTPPRT